MKKTLIILLVLALLALGGCGAPSYEEVEQQQYSSAAGYSLSLPADWTNIQEDEELTTFVSADGSLALNISSELAGMEYHSLEELGDMAFTSLQQELLETISFASGGELNQAGDIYYRAISGQDEAGRELTAALYVYRPYAAIHYYLVFLAAGSAYDDNKYVIEGIMDSLTMDMSADQVYELVMELKYPEEEPEEGAE